MQNLNIATIQSNLFWEDIDKNIIQFENDINSINDEIDVIILPETFNSGFSMNIKLLAEKMDGKTVSWMRDTAVKKNTCLIGSLIIKENNKYYNRLVCAFKNGEIMHYDKRHLFTFGDEDRYFTRGEKRIVIDVNGWKICPLICYDLRFPIWSRNSENIDLYIYTANWPEIRMSAWDTLLRARAIENISYVIGVNRIGEDGTGKKHSGNSAIIDYKGNYLLSFPKNQKHIGFTNLSKKDLINFRKKFPALEDADSYLIKKFN